MTGDTIHNDNVKSIYGTASDGLEIYHDGTDSYISDVGTGDLKILSSLFRLQSNGGESMITAFPNGSVFLYNDASLKLRTTSAGIEVTGNGAFTGSVSVPDAGQVQLGTGNNMVLQHNSANGFIKNTAGQLNIDQLAVTESIVFRTSDANAGDVTALTINRSGDLITGRDVTIAGDLTVNGTTTTVNTETLSVQDPLIELAKDNTANSLDIGYYGKYNDGTTRYLGLFNDASDSNKFKLFRGTTVEPTTTVNIGGAGYVAADLVVAGFEATTGTFSSNVFMSTNGSVLRNTGGSLQLQSDSSTVILRSNNTTALTLDNSQNATFAGDVSLTNTSSLILGSIFKIFNDGNNSIIRSQGEPLYIDANDITFRGYAPYNSLMTIKESGNVGIGTTTPSEKLEVYEQTANTAASILVDSASWNAGLKLKNGNGTWEIFNDYTGLGTTDALAFYNGGYRMVIDNTGNVGIGTTSPSEKLEVAGSVVVKDTFSSVNLESSTGTNQVQVKVLNAGGSAFFGRDNNSGSWFGTGEAYATTLRSDGAYPMIFRVNGANRLTIDSSGNSTFAGNVNVNGRINFYDGASNSTLFHTGNDCVLLNEGTGAIRAFTDGSEKMRIQANGNVGIGTATPSAKLQVGEGSGATVDAAYQIVADSSSISGIQILSGATQSGRIVFGDSSDNNIGTIMYDHSNNSLKTIVNAAERMRIDSAGNVGIGTNNPNAKLEVVGTGQFLTGASGVQLYGTGGSGNINSLGANDLVVMVDGDEKMRVRDSGNVGIGTDSPSAKLNVLTDDAVTNDSTNVLNITHTTTGTTANGFGAGLGFFIENSTYSTINEVGRIEVIETNQVNLDDDMLFYTKGNNALAERMRINSSGNVSIGSTSNAGYRLKVEGAGTVQLNNRTGSDGTVFAAAKDGTIVGSITVTSSATAFNTSSDYRLKEDLKDFAGLDMVSKIPVYDYKWKVDDSRSYGVMAHELEEVLPQAVSGEKDAEEMQSVDYSKIVPLLIKSIQELKAEIEILKAK